MRESAPSIRGVASDANGGAASAANRPAGIGRFVPAQSPAAPWYLRTPWYVFLRWKEASRACAPKRMVDSNSMEAIARQSVAGPLETLPQQGSIVAGRCFAGGDPSDPESWPFMT